MSETNRESDPQREARLGDEAQLDSPTVDFGAGAPAEEVRPQAGQPQAPQAPAQVPQAPAPQAQAPQAGPITAGPIDAAQVPQAGSVDAAQVPHAAPVDSTQAPHPAPVESEDADAEPFADDANDYADLELDDDASIVPAAGGTFGVEDDHSGFGGAPLPDGSVVAQHDQALAANSVPAAWPQQPQHDARPTETVDEIVREGNRQVPAGGGTFGVTVDESGYEGAPGRPSAGPAGVSKFGVPPTAKTGFDDFAPGAEGREFRSPQFGTATSTETGGVLPMIAIALAVLALVILCLPGWAWIVGGVVGLAAIIIGAMSLKRTRRTMAMLGAIGGAIAVLIAIATAIFVFLV